MAYIVFLDTNIYENSNFSFQNSKFTKLKELIDEGIVQLIYNEVVYQEVRQHIGEYIKEAVAGYNGAISNKGFAPFRADANWGKHLELLDENNLSEEQKQNWDKYLKNCSAYKISVRDVNVDAILEKYFRRLLPFENKKQTEFKDAIAIESIKEYFDSITDEKIYVVSMDKGFRKSFRDDDNIVTFDNLNKFLNFVILQSEFWAQAVNEKIKSEDFGKYISYNLLDLINGANVDLEDCYDGFDIDSVEYIEYEIGYIDVIDNEKIELTLEITAQVYVEHSETDEENSYYDKEEGRYLWEEFIKYKDKHKITFDAILSLNVMELDEEEVKEKANKYQELLEEFDESMLNITIEIDELFIPDKAFISLNDRTLVESEIINRTVDDNSDENYDYSYISDDLIYGTPYTVCPDCGKPISRKNDGGNGFCIECAPEH